MVEHGTAGNAEVVGHRSADALEVVARFVSKSDRKRVITLSEWSDQAESTTTSAHDAANRLTRIQSPEITVKDIQGWADDTEGVVFASDGGAGEAAAPSPHARASPSTACGVKKTSRG